MNCAQSVDSGVPFGGYKQSGIGRELGEYALDTFVFVFFSQSVRDLYIYDGLSFQIHSGQSCAYQYWTEAVKAVLRMTEIVIDVTPV